MSYMKREWERQQQALAEMPRALITGITGQDGSYLTELLLDKGYIVHGIIRRSSSFNTARIDHLISHDRLHLHYGDLLDPSSLRSIMTKSHPDEVYNLAAQSHVKVSFEQPAYTTQVISVGAVNLLEAVRDYEQVTGRMVRYYQASSSEMFGNAPAPQNENTPFRPVSPYACAKVQAFHVTRMYREAYRLHASNGILFNHESPRRGETFVTRKITRAVGRILAGTQDRLVLGNLDAKRDWGYAGDYVHGMWLMLQQEAGDDYVLATGETHSVREWVDWAFDIAELDSKVWVETDPRYRRPADVDCLQGDAAKARRLLGWEPVVKPRELCRMMLESDTLLARREVAASGIPASGGSMDGAAQKARPQHPQIGG